MRSATPKLVYIEGGDPVLAAANARTAATTKRCEWCGAHLAITTPQRGHEQSQTCQAARNVKEMRALGLARCDGRTSIAYLLAKRLGFEARDVVDYFKRPTYGRGRKTFGCYVPKWIVDLFNHPYPEACVRLGYINAENYYDDHVGPEVLELLTPLAKHAHENPETRAAVEAAFALGGVDAVVHIAGQEMP